MTAMYKLEDTPDARTPELYTSGISARKLVDLWRVKRSQQILEGIRDYLLKVSISALSTSTPVTVVAFKI